MKALFVFLVFILLLLSCNDRYNHKPNISPSLLSAVTRQKPVVRIDSSGIDTILFNKLQLHLVNNKPSEKWPVKTAYPLKAALLPFNRIVAYYGNFYSAGMGILGELNAEKLIEKLQGEMKKWQAADTVIPVLPAVHYIAVTAQDSKGKDGKYRLRMPGDQIEKAIELAQRLNGIVFLDIQVGHSTVQEEIPVLKRYLQLPNVHLGIDPEYSMKNGEVPCTVIGTFDATDINFASEYLAELVREYNLPPKVLVVHRFTQNMVTNYKKIVTRPEVQVVMNMDGFGSPAKKRDSYKGFISNQPVQFTGFKLFYRQDDNLMEPKDVLKLYPRPVYIQYQ